MVTKIYGYVFFSSRKKNKETIFLVKMFVGIKQIWVFHFSMGKKRNKPVWVGVGGEDGLGNRG
jgi:hypothetical protein